LPFGERWRDSIVEVSYTTTVDDYVTFSLHMWRKSKVLRGSYLVSWLWLPLLALFGAVVCALIDLGDVAVACVAGAVLYAAIYPAYYRSRLQNHVRLFAKELGLQGVIGPIHLILSDESLMEITERTRSEAKWRDMEGIEEMDGYTFIMVTGLTAAIVPRHAFEREDDYYAVRDFARARIGCRAEQGAAADRPRD
jgi:hypothetical protein